VKGEARPIDFDEPLSRSRRRAMQRHVSVNHQSLGAIDPRCRLAACSFEQRRVQSASRLASER